MKLSNNSANSKNKTFTFKYDPTISLVGTFTRMNAAVQTGKSSVSLHQISFANIEDITSEFISPRPKLFACLVEKRPQSLYQLAKLLRRDYANVYKGVIKLEKDGERIKLIPLYDEIVFDFQVKRAFPQPLAERIPSLVN